MFLLHKTYLPVTSLAGEFLVLILGTYVLIIIADGVEKYSRVLDLNYYANTENIARNSCSSGGGAPR